MNMLRIGEQGPLATVTDLGPGLNGFSALPLMPQSREVVVAQLRALITPSSPPTARTGIPLHDRAVTRWSALTIDLLARAVGLPAAYTRTGGGLGFVSASAGEVASLALAAALTRAGRAAGITGTETVYVTARTSVSVTAAVLAAGLGRAAVRMVDAEPDTGRMSAAALANILTADMASGRHPVMVVATVGDACGAFDDLAALGKVSRRAGAWLHIDAQAGAYALLPKRRNLLAGAGQAQSVCLDPGILVDSPLPCVIGWTTEPTALRTPALINALGARHHYLGLETPERALNLALALRCSGLDRMRGHLRSQLNALRDIVTAIRSNPQWTMAALPGAGSAIVRVNSGQGRHQDDILTLRVAARLRDAGLRTVHSVVLDDRSVLRIAPDRVVPLSADKVLRELTAALTAADTRDACLPRQVRYA
jgi:aromatic-L-amino-acid decarboxylase